MSGYIPYILADGLVFTSPNYLARLREYGGTVLARTASDTANHLMGIYRSLRRRYTLTKDEFKSIAGKEKLRAAFLHEVDELLREDGYLLVDLQEEEDRIGIVRINTIMSWPQPEGGIIEEHSYDDPWDEDEE